MKKKEGPHFYYLGFENEHFKNYCKSIVEPLGKFYPWWCNEVIVKISENLDCIASVTCEPNYRRVKLYIHLPLLEEKEDYIKMILKHELCHVIQGPLVEFVRNTILAFVKQTDPKCYEYMSDQLDSFYESTTEDLCIMLNRAML